MSENKFYPLISNYLGLMAEMRIARDPILKGLGLSSPCISIIAGLYRFGESSRIQLAEKLGLSTTGLGRPIEQLLELKLIKRKEDSENRRFIKLSLTAKGEAKAKSYRQEMSKIWQSACKDISENELQTLIQAFDKMVSELKKIRN